MKKFSFFLFTTLFTALLLFGCGSAGEDKTASTTEKQVQETDEVTNGDTTKETEITTETTTEMMTETITEGETEKPEEYTDLSSINSTVIENDKSTYTTVNSTAGASGSQTTLVFDANETGYEMSALEIANIHNSTECSECGYKEIGGRVAYRICSNSDNQGGMLLVLNNPINASLVSSMSITYMTSREIGASQIRILRKDATRNDAFVNECPSMSGATKSFKTVDLGMTAADIQGITDGDGYIRAFKLYFRDKDNSEIYISEIKFNNSFDSICKVDTIYDSCFYRKDAINSVAQIILDRFNEAGVEAEITVKAQSYSENSEKKPGKLVYSVIIALPDGTEHTFKAITADINTVSNCWLELSDSPYGAERDSLEQWKTSFNSSGIIRLSDNRITSYMGLETVEYAVIGLNDDHTSSEIEWHAPQSLTIRDEEYFSLYINAFLDYGTSLENGKDYRFVVRGVTGRSNYVLHLDIPFTYEQGSPDIESALLSALDKLSTATLSCNKSLEDKDTFVIEELNKLIGNDSVALSLSPASVGTLSSVYTVKLSYANDLYGYNGDALTDTVTLKYGEQTSSITLTYPEDGQENIIIASESIISHTVTDLDILKSKFYPFVKEESCLPPAVVLKWEDSDGGDKTYTVTISESGDMSDPITLTVNTTSAEVYNLKANTVYFWQVSAGGEKSAILSFKTSDHVRFIRTDNISNFRDIGGYVTLDGKRVKQGLAYRSGQLEAVSTSDKKIITEDLGIKTDLDLRGQSTYSPLGRDINMFSTSIQWYTGVFPEENHGALRQAIAVFADEDNYPMVYHCAIGRDRTGTVTMLILGLLGVDEDTLIREYLLSFNSVAGHDGTPSYVMVTHAQSFINGLKAYGAEDATLSEHIEAFMLEIGVTEEQIQSIKDILLEE